MLDFGLTPRLVAFRNHFLPAIPLDQTRERLSNWKDEIVGLARDLIAISSPSGAEGDLARFLVEKMRELQLADARIDAAGNVVGLVRGRAPGPTMVLATHLDTIAPGERGLWEHDPLGGEIADGFLHGLGAASNKAALAAQVFAAAAFAPDLLLAGNLVVASVVAGEPSGSLGMQVLFERTLPDLGLSPSAVVLGDPTGLSLFVGHRGRAEIEVATYGRTSHASAPWLGLNAIYKMQPVLGGIADLATALPSHPFLDKSTIAVTGIEAAPGAFDRIPDRCVVRVDRRYLPGESLDTVVSQLRTIVARCAAQDPEFQGEVRIRSSEERTYTGLTRSVPRVMSPWLLRDDHPLVSRALAALANVGQEPGVDKWFFATDGSFTAGGLGLPTIGYSPGQERYAGTPYDRVLVDDILRAAIGTASIVASLEDAPNVR